jgi:hypothetical protein
VSTLHCFFAISIYTSHNSHFPFKYGVSRAVTILSAVAQLFWFRLQRRRSETTSCPSHIFSLNHHFRKDFGSHKEFCQYCFTCLSVFLVGFLSRSDPVAHRYLLCLEVWSWEIYDIIFTDTLPQYSQTMCHIWFTQKTNCSTVHTWNHIHMQQQVVLNIIHVPCSCFTYVSFLPPTTAQ